MFNVSYNGIITVNRGDSFTAVMALNAGNELNPIEYEMTPDSFVYFAVMEPNQPFEDAILKKKLDIDDMNDNGDIVINFKPQDTQCLLPGRYYYQVKLQVCDPDDYSKYEVHTIIDKTQFFILE